jgi:NADPH:quinone reductase-like Zn-dependent oxidoreductase
METWNGDRMKRVVVDHYGGPEVVTVIDDQVPRPGPGEVGVRVLAAGVSYTDAMLRAGSYLGVPKPPFTPGYELVGIVEALGPGCSRLRLGDRIGTLTVWGADAERVCVLEANAVEVPEDIDPGELMSLVFTHMTAYQLLHSTAKGGRLVVFGHSGTVANGRKSWRGWIKWYATTATVELWGLLSPRRRVLVYRIQKLREGHQWLPMSGRHPALAVGGGPRDPDWFREAFDALLELLREDKIHPVVAERLPL